MNKKPIVLCGEGERLWWAFKLKPSQQAYITYSDHVFGCVECKKLLHIDDAELQEEIEWWDKFNKEIERKNKKYSKSFLRRIIECI